MEPLGLTFLALDIRLAISIGFIVLVLFGWLASRRTGAMGRGRPAGARIRRLAAVSVAQRRAQSGAVVQPRGLLRRRRRVDADLRRAEPIGIFLAAVFCFTFGWALAGVMGGLMLAVVIMLIPGLAWARGRPRAKESR